MLRKRYIIGLLLAIFMICAVVSAVDTVSAAKYKVIDKGTKSVDLNVKSDKGLKSVWKTKSNGKKLVVDWKVYQKSSKKKYELFSNIKITVTKVSKTKVKVIYVNYRTKYGSYSKKTYYERSKLSLKSYYLEYYKPSVRLY